MAPLNKLLTKESLESKIPFTKQWTPEQAACSFEQLKENLAKPGLAIRHADFDRPFLVHVDWSKNGLGAILAQVDDGGNEYIICCSSRSLNAAEKNYSSFQGEMLGVCWALRLYRHYLYGAPFDVYTDHKPIVWLQHNHQLTGKHARWFMTIQDLSFRLIHRAGKDHINADFLSRCALQGDHDSTGARVDHCTSQATVSATLWDPESFTFFTHAFSPSIEESDGTIIEREAPVNPAREYMGTSRRPDSSVYLDTVIKGTHIQACTRHSAATAVSNPTVSATFQTGTLTTFSDASGSDLFHDSQFESLTSDSADDQRRALHRKYQDVTRWIIRAYTVGMHVSPDGAFKQGLPAHQPSDSTREPQQRTTLDTRIVGYEWMQQAKGTGGVIVIDVFGGMGAMLEAVLRAGLRVRKYLYCDTDKVATRVMERRLLELALRFPA